MMISLFKDIQEDGESPWHLNIWDSTPQQPHPEPINNPTDHQCLIKAPFYRKEKKKSHFKYSHGGTAGEVELGRALSEGNCSHSQGQAPALLCLGCSALCMVPGQ